MKRITLVVAFCLILGIVFIVGFIFGNNKAEDKAMLTLEVGAEQQLALLLEALDELEKGDASKAQWMIQSGTAGQLETIIDSANFENKNSSKFRCVLLNKYKKYYKEKKLFASEEWASILEVDGMREAKEKREVFFEKRLPEICPEIK